MPDHRAREQHEPVGGAANIHEICGEQKERHSEQNEGIIGVEGLLHQRHGVQARLDDEDRQAGEAEGECDRHTQEQQQEKQPEQNERRGLRR